MNKKYNAYLLSEKWLKIREALFKKRGRKCQRCGSKNSLHVHHLTYRSVYNELPEHLEILCHNCHQNEHSKPKKKQKKFQKKKKAIGLSDLGYTYKVIKQLYEGKKVNTKFFIKVKSCLDK